MKAQNYYFCNTRSVFHVFDVSKNLDKIEEKLITKYDPSKKGTEISPRGSRMPPGSPKMPQNGPKSPPKTPPRPPKTPSRPPQDWPRTRPRPPLDPPRYTKTTPGPPQPPQESPRPPNTPQNAPLKPPKTAPRPPQEPPEVLLNSRGFTEAMDSSRPSRLRKLLLRLSTVAALSAMLCQMLNFLLSVPGLLSSSIE